MASKVKVDKKSVLIALFGLLVLGSAVYSGYGPQSTTIVSDVGTQSIVGAASVATIDFVPGTDRVGDIVASVIKTTLNVNSTFNIVNATVYIHNGSAIPIAMFNTSALATFPADVYVSIPEPTKSQYYTINVTGWNNTASFRGSSNVYYNRPNYNVADYAVGKYHILNATDFNRTLTHKEMYYPTWVIDEAISSSTMSTIIIVKP